MTSPPLDCVILEPARPARSAVIWLHGLGADGFDFAPVPRQLDLPKETSIRWVFPHAPSIPVTLNMGQVMPAWYDISSLESRDHDDSGIKRSSKAAQGLISHQIESGISPENIVLAGFSQGGAIALHAGLREKRALAGILALSAYLLRPEKLQEEASPANRKTAIFQGHGTEDPMVQIHLGRSAHDTLKAGGWQAEWREYAMAHQVNLPELRDVAAWLARVI